jgi:hypothetical protein
MFKALFLKLSYCVKYYSSILDIGSGIEMRKNQTKDVKIRAADGH